MAKTTGFSAEPRRSITRPRPGNTLLADWAPNVKVWRNADGSSWFEELAVKNGGMREAVALASAKGSTARLSIGIT